MTLIYVLVLEVYVWLKERKKRKKKIANLERHLKEEQQQEEWRKEWSRRQLFTVQYYRWVVSKILYVKDDLFHLSGIKFKLEKEKI